MLKQIEHAFDNTDPAYMEKSLEQRNPGPNSAGSVFHTPTTFDDLKYAEWEPANDPAIQPPGQGFTASISGTLGITRLDSLPMDKKVVFQPAHKGQAKIREGEFKGQCPAECAANLLPDELDTVGYTTLIIGPDRADSSKEVVWTFFPGPATFKFKEIPFTKLQEMFGYSKDEQKITVTVREAISLGFNYCKNINEPIK